MEQTKLIAFGTDCREQLREGMKILNDAVTATLGPMGRNVIIQKEYGPPVSTKDGVTVAKEIDLKDPIQNAGAQMLKQAASKTADVAGDGTTTSTLLAYTMVDQGMTMPNDVNVVEVKRGIDMAIKDGLTILASISKDIVNESDIENVAIISSNNDPEIGKLIATALSKVGKDGVVVVEESKTSESKLEIVEGMQFDRGFISPYFATAEDASMCVLENPYILVCDKKLANVKEIIAMLEGVSKTDTSILIIAEDISDELLATLVVNKSKGLIKCCAVKAPEFGNRREQVLQDIALVTGGTFVSEKKGFKLDKIKLEDLGTAKKVTVTKDKTTIIDGAGKEDVILNRLTEIRASIENATSDYEKQKDQERLAKLVGGIAILHIGAFTELELKEKRDRTDDALRATKAAIDEGIVPGGGSALMYVSNMLIQKYVSMPMTENQRLGVDIVIAACKAPVFTILKNAGLTRNDIETDSKIIEDGFATLGFDVKNKRIVNMFDAGIVDPTKVVRIALENAGSIAGTVLLSQAIVYFEPKLIEPKNNINQDEYSA